MYTNLFYGKCERLLYVYPTLKKVYPEFYEIMFNDYFIETDILIFNRDFVLSKYGSRI